MQRECSITLRIGFDRCENDGKENDYKLFHDNSFNDYGRIRFTGSFDYKSKKKLQLEDIFSEILNTDWSHFAKGRRQKLLTDP